MIIHQLTEGIGVDRAIDAVGVDANAPDSGPAAEKAKQAEAIASLHEFSTITI